MENKKINKRYLQKIKELSAPLYQSLADTCKASHERYQQKNKERIHMERLNRIQYQQDELQRELVQVLQNFSYPKLKQVYSIADLRQDGYIIRDGKIAYSFTIDKTDWNRFPLAICNIIKDSMNKDIFTFRKNLASSYFLNDIFVQYPALYHGVRITAIENQEIMVRVMVVTNMPL